MKNGLKILVIGVFALALLSILPSCVFATTITRVWGQISADTSVAVSQKGWSSSYVVVARDDYFADALAGAPLSHIAARVYGSSAPILLTHPQELPAEIPT